MPCHSPDPDDDYRSNSLEKDLFFKVYSFLNITPPEATNITKQLCELCRSIDEKDLKKIISNEYRSYSGEKINLYNFYEHHLLKDLKFNASIGDLEHAQLTLNELKRIKGD